MFYRRFLYNLLVLQLLCAAVSGQQISYKRYSVKDGLPGSVIYQSLQDQNGFIWFATNEGVSRFDGRNFKNFSKEDGLPDNDIIKLFLDRHNNIWFISLSGIPSVFYNGSIKRFDCKGVESIAEDLIADSIILIGNIPGKGNTSTGYYHSIDSPGNWHFETSFRNALTNDPLVGWPILRTSLSPGVNYYFYYIEFNRIGLRIKTSGLEKNFSFASQGSKTCILPFCMYSFSCPCSDGKSILFATVDSLYMANPDGLHKILSLKKLGLNIDKDNDVSSLFSENDSTIWLCTRNKGLIRITSYLSAIKKIQHFFVNDYCSAFLKDREGGYWLTTLDNGVYYLPNFFFQNLSSNPSIQEKEVRCIKHIGPQKLAAGFDDGTIITVNTKDFHVKEFPLWLSRNKNNRVLDIWPYRDKNMVIASDGGLYMLKPFQAGQKLLPDQGLKEILVEGDSTIVISGASGVGKLANNKKKLKYFYNFRASGIAYAENIYYFNTLHGVYKVENDSTTYMGDEYPALSGPVNHLDICSDSSLWASTQNGIVVLKNNTIYNINKNQGLPGNTCKQVIFDGQTAWAITNGGISRIDYQWRDNDFRYSVSNITEEDGLISNNVNQATICDGNIWAATDRGISFFPETYFSTSLSAPPVFINRIKAGNNELLSIDTAIIEHGQNHLIVDISSPSYQSGRFIHYQYRLDGFDSTWHTTYNNNIDLISIPFGQFTLEVRAVDRWEKRTAVPKKIIIINKPPFLKSSWFVLFTYVATIAFIALLFYFFNRRRTHKRDQLYQINKKIHDLEMMALRAQMNPHFIFNCLSSIQHYMLRSDTVNANLYLHKFSTLIRQILQQSDATFISLTQEIKFLKLYLELEKLRLHDRMDYQLLVPDNLNTEDLFIPPMVIQPYVENAIKHGITPLQHKQGKLIIRFELTATYINCFVEDNGAGIGASMQSRQPAQPEYLPMGTSITGNRIKLINSMQKNKILLQITDKQLADPSDSGTLVQLSFPVIPG